MRKQGFLILSLTIYAAILTMLVATMAQLARLVFPTMHLLMNWSLYTTFYTAHSFVQQKLALAPRDGVFFIRFQPHGVAWIAGDRIQSIEEKEGNLFYKEGDYNDGKVQAIQTTLLVRGCSFVIERTAGNKLICTAHLTKDPSYRWQCAQDHYG